MNKFQQLIDVLFLGGRVAKQKEAIKSLSLTLANTQEEASQIGYALLAADEKVSLLELEIAKLKGEA